LLFPVEESATSMRAPPLLFLSLLLASLHSGSGHRRLATGDVLNRELPAECGDALCLVQAILNKKPQIFITNNIDLKGVGILPTIENRVSISGVCDQSKCKVDAGGAAGIFVVGLGGYLTLKDLDLTGGFCSRGSAVLVSGLGADSSPSSGKLEALNVKFYNNIATDVGGAVAIDSGGSAYVKNSVFYNNKEDGGDVNVQAGQVGAPGAQLRSYSTVYSTSKAPNGMAVAVGPAASATFSKCDFSSYMMANSTACEGTCNVTCPAPAQMCYLQLQYALGYRKSVLRLRNLRYLILQHHLLLLPL
ncbi:hypothetical protein GOP47_0017034, partial [Adiantum capillus-veneris]